MKKAMILAVVMVMAAAGAKAQWYVGTSNVGNANGALFTGVTTQGDNTRWGIAPEIGYNLNERWAVALGIGFSHFAKDNDLFGVNPYVRYFAHRSGDFAFYLQGDANYATAMGDQSGKSNRFGINVRPGVMYNLSERFSINAAFGRLGYDKVKGNSGSFGLNLNMSSLDFGLAYSF